MSAGARTLLLVVLVGGTRCFCGSAAASFLIGRNAQDATIQADSSGHALVTFTSGGQLHRIGVSGATDARPPSRTAPQVEFDVDLGGHAVENTCTRVRVALPWLIAACRAGDGTYWALQSWQRMLPNFGAQPSAAQAAWELRVSHWSGPIAVLDVHWGWAYRRFRQLFGRYTYHGDGAFGYRVRSGVALDAYGRNIYVDALDSDIGKGWKRVNSFLAHQPIGGFCYGFYPHGGHQGVGRRMRATAIGPGVAPDVMWEGTASGRYSAAADREADTALTTLLEGDSLCHPR